MLSLLSDGYPYRFHIKVPRLPAYFTGTGDLLAALLLGWSTMYPDDLAKATCTALGALQAVLRRTAEAAIVKQQQSELRNNTQRTSELENKTQDKTQDSNTIDKTHIGERELQLIQSRDDMLRPPDVASIGITLEAIG